MASPLERLIQESIKPLKQTSVYVGLKRTVEPDIEPVDLDDAKLHCRVENGVVTDDALISALIGAARSHVESTINRSLITQTWELVLDTFPSANHVNLFKEPLASVTNVTTYDEADAATVMSTSAYRIDTYRNRITLVDGYSWPSDLRSHNGVIITYIAGYGGDPEDVPSAIRQAMLMLVAHWYVNREAVSDETLTAVPTGVTALLAPYEQLRI